MKTALSSLRFFFFFFVFIGHLGLTKIAVGHAFFIILSGFILMYVYEDRIMSNKISHKKFFVKRLIRIYPLHFITLLFSMIFVYKEIAENFTYFLSKLISNLFLVQAFIPNNEYYFSFNGVSWNVSVLLFCYLIFPKIVPYFSRINIKQFTVLMFAIVVLITTMMLLVEEKWHHALFYISPFTRFFDFIFGIYLYKLSAFLYKRQINYNAVEVLAVIIFFIFYVTANVYPTLFLPYAYSLFFWLPLGFLILSFNFEKGIISNGFLRKPIILYLSSLSFPFYMWHQLCIRFFERVFYRISDSTIRVLVLFITCLLFSLVTSYLYNIFEKKYIKKWLTVKKVD